MKFYCPSPCKRGSISMCEVEAQFREGTTFTNEPHYPVCPKYKKPKEAALDVKFSYFCSKCNNRHTEGNKICTEHRQYARTPVTFGKEA